MLFFADKPCNGHFIYAVIRKVLRGGDQHSGSAKDLTHIVSALDRRKKVACSDLYI